MRNVPLHLADWIPDALPRAPRPINGELLSSWARRIAEANGLTLAQLCAAIGQRSNNAAHAAIFDYASPAAWRDTVALFTRVPERWVWVLDLKQHFPAAGREWFLHDPRWPEEIEASFCPECFAEQLRTGKTLHLKAEWAVACVTRCLKHELPLLRFCPGCGERDPVRFLDPPAVECHQCQYNLVAARRIPAPEREPAIAEVSRLIVSLLAGRTPAPSWIGPVTAAGFRALILDLIWVFTTPELRQDRDTWAVVDGVAFERFRPIDPYNLHEQGPCFTARPPKQREAVVSAIAQVLFGSRSAEVFGIRDRRMCENLELHPFVEILRATNRNRARLFDHARHWPVSLRDRLREAQLRLSGPDPKCSLTFAKSQPTGLTGSLSCSKPLARRPAQSGR